MFFIGRLLRSLLFRLIVTAAVLVLGYIFIAKPLIDDTQNTAGGIAGIGDQVQGVMDSVTDAVGDGDPTGLVDDIQRQISGSDISREDAKRLERCIERASQDVQVIRRCAERFAG